MNSKIIHTIIEDDASGWENSIVISGEVTVCTTYEYKVTLGQSEGNSTRTLIEICEDGGWNGEYTSSVLFAAGSCEREALAKVFTKIGTILANNQYI